MALIQRFAAFGAGDTTSLRIYREEFNSDNDNDSADGDNEEDEDEDDSKKPTVKIEQIRIYVCVNQYLH